MKLIDEKSEGKIFYICENEFNLNFFTEKMRNVT